jgi:KaiC/GvpD/RAD55 family RecA-like ATPase
MNDDETYEDIKQRHTGKGGGKSKPNGSFTLTRLTDIKIGTSPPSIIEDLIPREGLVLVWGPPKCGKTFWCFDMVAHIALDRSYGKRAVEAGSIVYIAAEGEQGIKTRSVAFRQARMNDGEDPPFYLMTTALDLVADIDELVAAIAAQLQATENGCKAIVIDTLNRTIHGSESKDEDMSRYVQAADRLRSEFHCTIIIIHHCGTAGDRPRGHTSLTGAIDAQISVQKDADGTVLVTLELMKDGPEGAMMRYRLEPVDVGTDDRGKPITSCVVEHLGESTAGGQPKKKERKLAPAQKRALTLLNEAINTGGEVPPACNHIPANTRCVRESLWRQYCYQGAISAGDQDAKRVAYTRAVEALLGDSRIGCWDGWYWPV